MSSEFRELLKRVGSGTHTSKNLSRSETALATEMMLQQTATPVQIGAFTIAHRIKRPTPVELSGILDGFDRLGSKLEICAEHQHAPVVLGNPYDGRARTVPVSAITALILATTIPVVMHGGERSPTKYGIPLVEIWRGLGIDFSGLNLAQAQNFYRQTSLGLIYLPQHFVAAHRFMRVREEIGKRPPFATAELVWSPVLGDTHLVAGFVHPPTEERFRGTFEIIGRTNFTLVKGLEGSCDLSCNRTGIIALGHPNGSFERLLLDPNDYIDGSDVAFESDASAIALIEAVIQGQNNALVPGAILNGGFYLWRFKLADTLKSGMALAAQMLSDGQVADKLAQLKSAIAKS